MVGRGSRITHDLYEEFRFESVRRFARPRRLPSRRALPLNKLASRFFVLFPPLAEVAKGGDGAKSAFRGN
jgi:hypothetical protein